MFISSIHIIIKNLEKMNKLSVKTILVVGIVDE